MDDKPDWRSGDFVAYYANHDFPDFAQEFLRRNPCYRAEFKASQANPKMKGINYRRNMEVLARRWGMIFPFRSRARMYDGPRTLGARAAFNMRYSLSHAR